MSKTRSGTIISNYFAAAPGKRTRSSESLRETSGSPPDSSENLTSEPEAQKSTGAGALESPPSQEAGTKASAPMISISGEGALDDLPPSEGTSSTAQLDDPNPQGAQASHPPREVDTSAPSLDEIVPSLEVIVVDEESTKDEFTPSVESSIRALLNSDDNQVPRPNFEIEFEPSPKTPEPNQDQDPSPEPSPSPEPEPEKLAFEQNPEPEPELNEPELNTTQESTTVANLLSSQAQLLAPTFINPSLQPSPSTTPMSPSQSQNPNPSNNRLMTPTSIGSPSVPESISHFNTLAANAQPPTRRNSMSSSNEFENFMRKSVLGIEKRFDDFSADNQNTTRTLAGHADTLASHGNTLTQILTAHKKFEQDLDSLKQLNTALTQDLAQQSIKVTQLEKTIDDLKANEVNVQNVLKDMEELRAQIETQNETINTLNTEQATTSAEAIQEQVQSHIDTLNTQQFWQRELDKSANQLVFKNLAKTIHTKEMHPRQIFTNHILGPMKLTPEDEAKVTPIAVIDANKAKESANSHFLICTFSSIQAIAIIKQNAKNIPKQVRFCPKVPLKYTDTLNEYLKIQGQIRLLKDKNGTPIARTRLSTNKGYLMLEKSDRIGETFGPYHPIRTFIPEENDEILSVNPTKRNETHTLIQCRWKDPVSPATKQEILTHLKGADVEHASFNYTSHLLNITTKYHNHDKIINHIRLNPNVNASTVSSSAF